MEHNSGLVQLVGSDIHGFRSLADLDVRSIMEEARTRWLRPNEIHAILCNHRFFTINVKPVTLPKSGTIVLFDRKMFRNFRKDGYSWKKKKDGKTIKEAHEHLKVGNEERIHVYYAHGETNPTFVRRCYWLLDKSLDHIVLVHYRETQEMQPQGSTATPLNSYSNSGISDPGSWHFSEELDSAEVQDYSDRVILEDHAQRLREINTLEWDELLGPDVPQRLSTPQEGKAAGFELQNVYQTANQGLSEILERFPMKTGSIISGVVPSGRVEGLPTQDSFGRWITNLIADSPQSVDVGSPESSNESFSYPPLQNHDVSMLGQIFKILDISPGWASANEETKILVVVAVEGYQPVTGLKLYLACGNFISSIEAVQAGVYRCILAPQSPGSKKLYLTANGNKPISQVLDFEFRGPVSSEEPASLGDEEVNWTEYELQMRLAHLLFSSRSLSTYSKKVSEASLREARAFYRNTSNISESWLNLGRLIEDAKMSFPQAKNRLFELILQSRLREWLLEKVISGDKVSERDEKGHGVIHLCTILGYTWAVQPFSLSGLSLDYRDKWGWTALHWAASHGKEKMVAALLSNGAKPYLVTDPTSENPIAFTASDLASRNGYNGLAAYLDENALVVQLNDMTIAGNASDSVQPTASANDIIYIANLTEEELNVKETLAAYRTAVDAASRIQAAFRMRSLNIRTKQAELDHAEMEARNIVAALKIQHAFKNYEARKKMAAAARIQHRFRTWKMRRDFVNMRRQAIRIQAHFRGYQVRKQYGKLVWSVGVLEKAILRWRLKRKGFRGLQVQVDETISDSNPTSDVEEAFFKASQREAENRVERSVSRVQAMMHSKEAQEEYRRVKREHIKATLEFQEPQPPDYEII